MKSAHFLPDILLMQDHHIVSECAEFEHPQSWSYHVRVVSFLEYAERQNEYWVSLIYRGQTMVATFVDIDNVVAVCWFCIGHTASVQEKYDTL